MLAWIAYQLTDRQALIDADRERWASVQRSSNSLRRLLRIREFRSLYYYRLSRGNRSGRLVAALLRRLRPGERTLFLDTEDIGPGLFIQHGFATIVAAEKIGANCWINQQVTIGFKVTDGSIVAAPTLEDGVIICAGAKVIGGVTVGTNSTVGANAVVVKDVPPNSTAIGVPAVSRPQGRSARSGDD